MWCEEVTELKLASRKPVREVKVGVRRYGATHRGTCLRNAGRAGTSSWRAKLSRFGFGRGLVPVAAHRQFADTDNLSNSSAAEPPASSGCAEQQSKPRRKFPGGLGLAVESRGSPTKQDCERITGESCAPNSCNLTVRSLGRPTSRGDDTRLAGLCDGPRVKLLPPRLGSPSSGDLNVANAKNIGDDQLAGSRRPHKRGDRRGRSTRPVEDQMLTPRPYLDRLPAGNEAVRRGRRTRSGQGFAITARGAPDRRKWADPAHPACRSTPQFRHAIGVAHRLRFECRPGGSCVPPTATDSGTQHGGASPAHTCDRLAGEACILMDIQRRSRLYRRFR
ncbi:hypothetical protein BKP42_63490 [Rhodococcus erythropolis]|nr:hypothetical protein BKP42_63490 [Rhodococcus erythropolis]